MYRSLLKVVFVLVLTVAPAGASSLTCLTGSDPATAGDATALAAVRALVDAACPCASFDGLSVGHTHGDYIRCARPVVAAEVAGGHLRRQCMGNMKRMLAFSTCGFDPALGARPCITRSLVNGSVSCRIRARTTRNGTPRDKCINTPAARAVQCPAFTHCMDAADTNADLRIAAPNDNGLCAGTGQPEVICQTLAPLPSGTCTVTPGTTGTILVGDVLAADTIYRGGQVVIDGSGNIVQAGCAVSCESDPSCQAVASAARKITCPRAAISPGLINTHDHLAYTQNAPVADTGERYEQRHDWREGVRGHTAISVAGSATADQVAWGELRFLMGGATSTVGSGGTAGVLRNLDQAPMQEDLAQTPVGIDNFPLGDSDGTQLDGTCSYPAMVTPAAIAADDAYLPHVAEGIDAVARNEAICLSDQNPINDITLDKTTFIQAVGMTASDYANMAANGTSLIWSPRSNIRLYGDTAAVTTAARTGVAIALGTDWMPTGSMNLLRELECADSFNRNYLDGFFSDKQLWKMVTATAAEVTATDDVIGTLATGKVADVAIFNEASHDGYRAVIDAQPADVVLVMRAGEALYGDAAILSALPGSGTCDMLDVCGVTKDICLLGEIGKSYAQLSITNGGSYPDFFCDAPASEPTCTPSRTVAVNGSTIYDGTATASDSDGDGIADTSDNCPSVFNPIRPLDDGVQADADGDGAGDACDPCPLDANTVVCSTFSASDSDGDGVANEIDNCPSVANADQADADADGKGDACDACPAQPNPGAQVCLALATFGPSPAYVRVGQSGVTTIPTPLTVTLNAAPASDTFVPIVSSAPASLTVVGGGVTVLAGQTSAQVLLDGLAQSADVTLTATFGVSLQSQVRVLGVAEVPTLVSLTPAATNIVAGATRTFTVGLDIPAPAGGTTVALALTPSSAGTIPASVTIPQDQTSASFDYVDGLTATTITIDASLDAVTLSATLTVLEAASHLVINEIDYDQVGTDSDEFVEIYNGTAGAVSLAGIELVLVNGGVAPASPYLTINLSSAGTLAAGQYLVVGSATVTVPVATLKLEFATATNSIQNGAPDGAALVDTNTNTLIDALSYEGSITNASIAGLGTVSLVEGTALDAGVADSNTVIGSLSRLPDGTDSDDAASDWAFSSVPTPGASNVP